MGFWLAQVFRCPRLITEETLVVNEWGALVVSISVPGMVSSSHVGDAHNKTSRAHNIDSGATTEMLERSPLVSLPCLTAAAEVRSRRGTPLAGSRRQTNYIVSKYAGGAAHPLGQESLIRIEAQA